MRVLRGGLQLQGRDLPGAYRAHDSVEGRKGQSRPQLHQRPLCIRLLRQPRSRADADDPHNDRRTVAERELARGDRIRREGPAPRTREVRQDVRRRDFKFALHQRRDLSHAEVRPRGARQQ